jgi:hypothetical protein
LVRQHNARNLRQLAKQDRKGGRPVPVNRTTYRLDDGQRTGACRIEPHGATSSTPILPFQVRDRKQELACLSRQVKAEYGQSHQPKALARE